MSRTCFAVDHAIVDLFESPRTFCLMTIPGSISWNSPIRIASLTLVRSGRFFPLSLESIQPRLTATAPRRFCSPQ